MIPRPNVSPRYAAYAPNDQSGRIFVAPTEVLAYNARWNTSTTGVTGLHMYSLVCHRREPEPREQRELEEVRGIAQVHVERREQDAEGAREQEDADQRERDQRHVGPRDVPTHDEERDDEHETLEEEVHERGADRGEWEDLARERDLVHDAGVGDDRSGRAGEPRREQVPHEQTREQEERERGDRGLQDDLERDVEDDEVEQRVDE